jgi:tRNA ligase
MKSEQAPESGLQLWSYLVEKKRVLERLHVTILHTKEKHMSKKLWECCIALRKSISANEIHPTFIFTFDHIVWNNNIMALSVSDLKIEMPAGSENEHRHLGEAVIEQIPEAIAQWLHLTIGTRDDTTKPFEAAAMVAGWRSGKSNDVQSIPLENCVVKSKFSGRYR